MTPGLSKIRFRDAQIEMAHGAGGKASRRLIEGLFAPLLFEGSYEPLGDAAFVQVNGSNIAITTDSFVVKPLSGAQATALVVTFVLEAGLPTETLEAEIRAMATAARRAGVVIAGGDTKVVEHGKADQIYISSCGVGFRIPGISLSPITIRPGDQIILSGPIGDHGITILLARGELDLQAELRSDTRSILPMVQAIAGAAGPGIRWMRDPTRGGVATSLNELARDCGLGVVICEDKLPIHDAVRGACELLGLDPLHIANEGQFLAVVAPDCAEAALSRLRQIAGGEEASIIGEMQPQPAGTVLVSTLYGSKRIVDMLVGDPLPRIC
jgi:hydrogenase expression/formation protein HypE